MVGTAIAYLLIHVGLEFDTIPTISG